MNPQAMLVASFVLGALAQVFLLSSRPFPWGKAGICVLIAMFGFLPGKHEVEYQALRHVLETVVIFGFVFAFTAQRSCLPAVREGMVWAMTLVLWFVVLLKWNLQVPSHRWVVLALLLPSLWSLYLCWSNQPVGRVGKVADYLWFLAVVVLLGVWGYPFSPLALFGNANEVPWISPVDGFFGGMTFMVLVMYGTYLYLFVPIPGRHQSWASRMKEWREFVANMVDKFHAQPGNRTELAVLSAVLVGVFLTHYWVKWMNAGIIVGLAISLISVWSWLGNAQDQPSDAVGAPKGDAA